MAHNRISAAAETVTRFDEDGGKINRDDSHFLREVYCRGMYIRNNNIYVYHILLHILSARRPRL